MNKLLSPSPSPLPGPPPGAQTTLQGTITNTEGQPLSGWRSWGDQPSAPPPMRRAPTAWPACVRVRCGCGSHVGHAPVDTTFTLQAGPTPRTSRCAPRSTRSARRGHRRPCGRPHPVAKSTLTRERIERINTGVDLPILLDLQPSVVTTTDAGTGFGYTGIACAAPIPRASTSP